MGFQEQIQTKPPTITRITIFIPDEDDELEFEEPTSGELAIRALAFCGSCLAGVGSVKAVPLILACSEQLTTLCFSTPALLPLGGALIILRTLI